MNDRRTQACTICGGEPPLSGGWFLIAENRWEDKLQILEWSQHLAAQPGVHHACTASHVQELVVHWMTTGSLHYPFAQVTGWERPSTPFPDPFSPQPDIDLGSAKPIGELSVDRESLHRVLLEAPNALKSVLDALSRSLQRDLGGRADVTTSSRGALGMGTSTI